MSQQSPPEHEEKSGLLGVPKQKSMADFCMVLRGNEKLYHVGLGGASRHCHISLIVVQHKILRSA